MDNKIIRNLKINRVTFLVFGIIFFLLGFLLPVFLIIGGGFLFLAYATNKKYKQLQNDPDPARVKPLPVKVKGEQLQVTDLDGSVIMVDSNMELDDSGRVLIVSDGNAYHTHLSCYKNWRPEYQENFNGWTLIKKSDARKRGLYYCSFCKENDRVILDDLLDNVD